MKKSLNCPCDSNKLYTVCCGRYHKGKIHAPTAEALMRSRYSAYITDNTQYIYRSWDENTRPTLKVLRDGNSQKFINLKIINTDKGGLDDETGTVEFIASYTFIDDKGRVNESSYDKSQKTYQHHETSFFVKRNNRWLYVNELNNDNSHE